MTIKLKIALFNALLLGIVMGILLFFMMSASEVIIETNVKQQLRFVMENNGEEVDYDDGKLELDDVRFYVENISTLVYSGEGAYIAGYVDGLEIFQEKPLKDGVFQEVTVDGEDFFIFDTMVSHRKHGDIYLRGLVSLTEASQSVDTMFFFTFLALPLFLVFVGLGSYFIAYLSMKPLEKIVSVARDISHGDDLSSRISLGEGKDEVSHLASTFDEMFGKLEGAFLSEKQFSSDVSHELRTPTAVILAECELQLSSALGEEERLEGYGVIQRQGLKMQKLISTLLNLIRMDNGVTEFHLEPVDLSELVYLVCEEQESLSTESQRLALDLQEGIFCTLDYTMMIRVLSNLIDNGFKYGQAEGFVKVSLREEGERVVLEVSDDGIGISSEDLGKIFHRFYQVDPSRHGEKDGGMGLGLSMVAQMVKLQGGEITVESTLGEGAMFRICFPKSA